MCPFQMLQVVPAPAPLEPSGGPPDLSHYEAQKPGLVMAFRRELAACADESRAGLIFNISDLGRVVVQVNVIRQTAAIVEFAQFRDPPEFCTRLARAVLLGGYKDADDAAFDLASAIPALRDHPSVLRTARGDMRPLMIQCFEERRWFHHPIPQLLAEAVATAFFDQFGATVDAPRAREWQQIA